MLIFLRSDFFGKSNNVLCFFSKLSSLIKYRVFHSYCMSLYGSELELLSNDQINDLCFMKEKPAQNMGLAIKFSLLFALAAESVFGFTSRDL